jgi:putative DNA methylase
MPGAAHFITYRLAGTIPNQMLEQLKAKKELLLARPLAKGMNTIERRRQVHKQLFTDYDAYLDTNRSIDWLAQPTVATMVRGNLYHHHGGKYHLLAYCVMANHVHVLLQPIEAGVDEAARFVKEIDAPCGEQPDSRSPLAAIMHSLKSYTAHEANKLLGRSGPFWQHESYDHWVRDEGELQRIIDYINNNPVKARLVSQPHEWLFGSARDRFLFDGHTSGFLGGLPPDFRP